MTPARSLTVTLLALAVLIGALPGVEAQFPKGLLAGEPGVKAPGGATCTIEVQPLAFGNYDPQENADLDALTRITYVCNNQANKIRIEMTTGYSNAFDRRIMTAGYSQYLDYNIYLDPTHRTVWGQGLFNTDVYYENNPPNGTPVVVPAYGRIRARQNVEPGEYLDGLTVRILF